MRYISTRGEAPELGFEDVLLAGLARDGGLYVPETWPKFSPETIAALAGRPFRRGRRRGHRSRSPAARSRAPSWSRMAATPTRRFGHPAVTPLVQIDRSLWVLELFHGPTLAFKDVAMQLLAAPDGPRARPTRRARDHRRRDLWRHRRRGDRGVPRLEARRRRRALPRGPRLRRAAAHDDDAAGAPTCTPSPSRARSTTARRW